MKKYKKMPWSKEERNLLSEHYYITSKKELYTLLPGRTPNAIRKQVGYLRARVWAFKHEDKSKK
jgi:hypothetical protein